ncbi:stress response translation initiation inhibitor YciH, partial [Arthrospira sp. O9.13F]
MAPYSGNFDSKSSHKNRIAYSEFGNSSNSEAMEPGVPD